MNRLTHKAMARLFGAACLALLLSVFGNTRLGAEQTVTGGLTGVTSVGFDAANTERSFKVGGASFTTFLKKDGTVGIKMTAGKLSLKGPTGEPLAELVEGDEIEIDGFLNLDKLFETGQSGNENVLRLGAIAAASFVNKGNNPVNFTVNNQTVSVSGGGGRQNAAIGKVYSTQIPLSVVQNLKPGESVVGLDTNGQPRKYTKPLVGETLIISSIDPKDLNLQVTRAGNNALDNRNLQPLVGVTQRIKVGDTTIEVTGTKDGTRVKVVDGPPLNLGSANGKFIGTLPVPSDIEITGLSMNDLPFTTPTKSSVLLLPPTINYTITNKGDSDLTLGTGTDKVVLTKNNPTMTGNKSGYSSSTGVNAETLAKLAPGTMVDIKNANGEIITVVVGDRLHPDAKPPEIRIINNNDHAVSMGCFGTGDFLLPPGGGIKVPLDELNIGIAPNGTFQFTCSDGVKDQIRNANNLNTAFIPKDGGSVLALQGNLTLGQCQKAPAKTLLDIKTATTLLGGPSKVRGLTQRQVLTNAVNKGSTGTKPPPKPVVINNLRRSNLLLSDAMGGSNLLPFFVNSLDGNLINQYNQVLSP